MIESPVLSPERFAAQRALYAALAKAIAETDGVAKNGKNDQGRGYAYAKAEDVIREAERVLTMNQISVAPGSSRVEEFSPGEQKAQGARPIFVLRQEFVATHVEGGELRGEVCVGIGTNLAAGPAQAVSSALTAAERDYYRCLLRMPRCDVDDPDHPKNTRAPREESEPRPPARPSAPVPQTRKATMVLRAVEGVKTSVDWDKASDKWNAVLDVRGKPGPDGEVSDEGYSDDEVASIGAALAKARTRVGA